MTEMKMENGKNGVYQNSDLGASGVCHKTPDQVGDDGLTVGSGRSKIPAFAGMTENIGGAGMRENKERRDDGWDKKTGMAEKNKTRRDNEQYSWIEGMNGIMSSESGKSMVEMLGVLALMGLLAVLGAKGYSMAMERATANRIVEEINRRSIVYSQQLLMTTSNTALNHSELATEIEGGYPVSGNRFGDDYFQIVVQKLPQNICTRIGKLGYARAIQVLANGTALTAADQSACHATGNVLTFTFTKDMTPCDTCLSGVKTCEGDGQCAINQVCQNGMCVCAPSYECNGKCCSSGQFCVNGACTATPACHTSDDCEQGYCSSGTCRCRSYADNCDYFCEMSSSVIGACSDGAYAEEGTGEQAGTVWSTKAMNWYTASDFCASLGKELVSLEDFGVCRKWQYLYLYHSGKV